MKEKVFRLNGQVQHYEWGGYTFIPDLLGFDNAQHKPCAEYWMGAHPSGSGKVETKDGVQPLHRLINNDPIEYLGEKVVQQFNELPYLFKVLDVREMLSIQVHPTKEEAIKGFDAEEAAGVPIDAKNRNYKDRNHKPEVMIALGEFWLLHGFKKKEELLETLQQVENFHSLKDIFNEQGYFGLYKYIMEMPQHEADELLLPLVQREASATHHSKSEPGYWVNKLYNGKLPSQNIDRGIFSIYFFNIVRLQQGEGIFQAAGVPHAYLQGQNIELMANSDNVIRGGLTAKHVDVPELLKHINFEGIEPNILIAQVSENGEQLYCLPAEDFGICAIHLSTGREYVNESQSLEIFLVMEGEVYCDDITSKKGEVFIIKAGTAYTIRAVENAIMYRAYVPANILNEK